MRTLRLKLVWLLVLPFLWFASPTGSTIAAGAALGLVGLLIRGWAAGTIRKEEELTTTGPYAYTRNPLYIGSLLLGVGITVGGGEAVWVALFVVFYLLVYTRTMLGEGALLTGLFGEQYAHYAAHVPAFVPRLIAYRSPDAPVDAEPGARSGAALPGAKVGGFTLARYRRNAEWEALLGFVLVFGYLTVRWWLVS